MSIEKLDSLCTIRSFLEEMAAQDNRATAFPYYYVIRTWCRDYCSYHDSDHDVECSCVEEPSPNIIGHVSGGSWVERGMFLTESDALGHLERNSYHYSNKAHTYVNHAWRATQLKEFLGALFEYFDMDKGMQE